jgi:hypothetical protein
MNSTPVFPRLPGLLATCALGALLNLAGACAALAGDHLLHVDVLDRDQGDALRVWRDHGRPVVAGRPGARYALRLVNDSGERVLAVVAIDGVNVVSGETAGVAQRGYVLEPRQSAEITGWRKSDAEVAAFEFTALADSYAARTGRPLDVGVIGVAVFREAARTPVDDEAPLLVPRSEGVARSLRAPPAPTAAAAPPEQASRKARDAGDDGVAAAGSLARPAVPAERLGTGHGALEPSLSRVTSFDRASARPDQRLEIRYDSAENLVAAGIIPPRRLATTAPHPFPADPPRGYVPDPPLR